MAVIYKALEPGFEHREPPERAPARARLFLVCYRTLARCLARVDAAALVRHRRGSSAPVGLPIAAVPRSASAATARKPADMAPASDAVSVTLYQPRRPLLRLDVAPFAVIYALLHAYAWTSLAYGTISYETLGCIPVAPPRTYSSS